MLGFGDLLPLELVEQRIKSSLGSLLPCGVRIGPGVGVLVWYDLLQRAGRTVGDGQGQGSVASTSRSLIGSSARQLRLGEPVA
jgi:hypothetical protein